MANRERVILGLVIVLCGLVLGGCGRAFDREFESAIKEGDLTKVKSMLAEDPKLVNAQAKKPLKTPLTVAIWEEDVDMTKLLIDNGANVNAKSLMGSLLHTALQHHNKELVELLISGGANVNATGVQGETLLFQVTNSVRASDVDKEIVKLLINNGADGNIVPKGRKSILCSVIMDHYWSDVAVLMIEKGVDVNASGRNGLTPLHGAAYVGLNKVVDPLITAGAKVNGIDSFGYTPLRWAIQRSHKETADLLRKHGAKE